MENTRRQFMGMLGGTLFLASPLAKGLSAEVFRSFFTGHIPINQHMTNETSAQFSILTKGSMPYAYQVYDSQGRELPVEMWDHEKRKDSPWGVDKLIVENLRSGMQYRLRVIDKNNAAVLDERFFKNLPLDKTETLRFGLISCSCDYYHYQNKNMWDHLFEHKPTMIFLIGDACYADLGADGSERDLWRRHTETRRTLNHFRKPELIPTLAVWDDHDFGSNNSNKYYKNKRMAQRCFQLLFGSKNVEGYENTLGVGFVFTGFGQRFFFMDGRYYRDVPSTGGMMWGAEQQELLLDMINKNNSPSWIFSGSQFFGSYKQEESFQNHYFKNLIDLTRKLSKVSAPVVFGSGDVHFSEIMTIEPRVIGYKTYEFTSSCMHSFNVPSTWIYKNPRREISTWKQNFMIIKSKAEDEGFKISSYTTGRFGRNLFYYDAKIKRG
ncbi:MAG: alkaline phosphatase D family protein [Bdellovibrio sp.]